MKDSFHEELERAFDKFPKYHAKILLGDFNAKVGRENVHKPTVGNESLHEISNDNGVRVVNFTTSVKRFVSLQFLNLRQSVGLLEPEISPSQGRHLTKHRINTNRYP
jgi:hypothetical protein